VNDRLPSRLQESLLSLLDCQPPVLTILVLGIQDTLHPGLRWDKGQGLWDHKEAWKSCLPLGERRGGGQAQPGSQVGGPGDGEVAPESDRSWEQLNDLESRSKGEMGGFPGSWAGPLGPGTGAALRPGRGSRSHLASDKRSPPLLPGPSVSSPGQEAGAPWALSSRSGAEAQITSPRSHTQPPPPPLRPPPELPSPVVTPSP
jgi:hypothetical protein